MIDSPVAAVASGSPHVHSRFFPPCQASARPPPEFVAKSSACPEPLSTTDGTPMRFDGESPRVLQRLHDTPFQLVVAAVFLVVTQKTSTW